jgi:hypothetical protein
MRLLWLSGVKSGHQVRTNASKTLPFVAISLERPQTPPDPGKCYLIRMITQLFFIVTTLGGKIRPSAPLCPLFLLEVCPQALPFVAISLELLQTPPELTLSYLTRIVTLLSFLADQLVPMLPSGPPRPRSPEHPMASKPGTPGPQPTQALAPLVPPSLR